MDWPFGKSDKEKAAQMMKDSEARNAARSSAPAAMTTPNQEAGKDKKLISNPMDVLKEREQKAGVND